MKEKFCSNCGEAIKENSNFCVECGKQITEFDKKSMYVKIDNEMAVPHKSPWAAAILNFFIPGIGFIYLGRTEFILIGIAILIDMLASVFYSNIEEWFNIGGIIFGIIIAFILAVSGYVAAEQINKQGGE